MVALFRRTPDKELSHFIDLELGLDLSKTSLSNAGILEIVAGMLIISALGFSFVVWYSLSPFSVGFPYYQIAAPVFLALFPVSLALFFKAAGLMRLPVTIGLVAIFSIAFFFMVPLQATTYTGYVQHCQTYFTARDWKSFAYSYFGVGFHIHYFDNPFLCQ